MPLPCNLEKETDGSQATKLTRVLCLELLSHLWPLSYRLGAPVAKWVKHWPTDLADRVRPPLDAKSTQP